MKIFRYIRYEAMQLAASPVKLFLTVITSVAIGVLTWLSCNGISLVWRASLHPSLCLPLPLLFTLCIFVYLLFGCLITLGYTCSIGAEICIKAAVAYFAFLFWCPLTLLAGIGICGACALLLSIAYLVYLLKIFWGSSLLGTALSLSIVVFEIYLVYFTVGFTIII